MTQIGPSREVAVHALAERRKKSFLSPQIDNGSLTPGSLMYFYCKYCGVATDELTETGWNIQCPPRIVCIDCEVLREAGWHDNQTPHFPVGARITPTPKTPN